MSLTAFSQGWRASSRIVHSATRSSFSTSTKLGAYEDTIKNLKIGKHTRVLYQGFTGRQATANAKESIAYGTNVVGGVKPGTTGEHLGLPVLPDVRTAVKELKPDASAIYVPGNGTVAAMEEAIENEISLIVAVAEHIPLHDVMRVQQILRTQSKTRLVGANCPGIINTWGRCRLGFQPLPFFKDGNIGIVAKSGTLSYEAVASTTRAGLGQTYCISMGGDILAGTNFVEALEIFEHDDQTEGIVLVGEIGGRAEIDAAEWIRAYKKRTANPKPFMAVIGGVESPTGRVMGHAGAWRSPGDATAREKIAILEKEGVVVVDHPEKLGEGMKKLLAGRSSGAGGKAASGPGAMQKRGYHTMRTRPTIVASNSPTAAQKRTLILKPQQALDMLRDRGVKIAESKGSGKMLAVSIDRSKRMPAIVASPTSEPSQMFPQSRRYEFEYGSNDASADEMITKVAERLQVSDNAKPALKELIGNLVDLYMTKEAQALRTNIAVSETGEIEVTDAQFRFDDAAFRSSKRQQDIHQLRDIESEVPEEVAAEKEGMAYVKMSGPGTLGTIVNGAGLAMNTVDALIARGGHPANFLDTGGKATKETIKASFQIVTSDPRVKAIFVNIFGGLTLGDMIANGILLAFKDLDLKVPVVVRIRGTNEADGQKLIQESGLKIDAFDSFEEAAERAIKLANDAS
ncbi:hypothetical protein LTR64_006959 [Lithohypha guttulata]|uniref:CoA-binding domain-containing protein n=1 Tax=Lithohypha guttulata TaxID=1690604 RepID=A0AAN7TEP0_9EURO|nr:hypothetical protein LTR51_004483 [Lithohypha guttulata]KAK5091091.1 hypothetical protein LTR05_001271 [Lithohypha guttulata]